MFKTKPRAAARSLRAGSAASDRAKGLTLIELGFVIIILATIVAVALTFYNSLSRNKEVTDTVTDVANIRQAVSSYAGGLPLIGVIGQDANGENVSRDAPAWQDLSPLLPGRLSVRARNIDSTELANANAWGSTYRLIVLPADPFTWALTINEIKDGLCQRVSDKLVAGASSVPTCTGDTGAETMEVEFRVGA